MVLMHIIPPCMAGVFNTTPAMEQQCVRSRLLATHCHRSSPWCPGLCPHHGNAAVLPILWLQPALLLVQTGFQELNSLKEVLKSSLKLKIADVLEAAEVKFKLPQGLLAVGKYFEYRSVQNMFAVKDHSWKKRHILITAIHLIKYNRFTISWTIDW